VWRDDLYSLTKINKCARSIIYIFVFFFVLLEVVILWYCFFFFYRRTFSLNVDVFLRVSLKLWLSYKDIYVVNKKIGKFSGTPVIRFFSKNLKYSAQEPKKIHYYYYYYSWKIQDGKFNKRNRHRFNVFSFFFFNSWLIFNSGVFFSFIHRYFFFEITKR